ncbi:MAG TPA: hypothetical protein VFT13_06625 [Candidatus Krumholzibacteria bacterium]|nr:hypothetical protein [Candidatus Krumholzibacteria bacterium]
MDRSSLVRLGFRGFISIRDLRAASLRDIPQTPGVYALLREQRTEPAFVESGTGGHFKGKNPNVPIDVLRAAWVPTSPVVYIGKAGGADGGSTLRRRLGQYLDFGAGKPVGHWGGRYIWQLSDAEDLHVCWLSTVDRDPESVEADLIEAFKAEHGKRPFANLRDGARRVVKAAP